MVDVGTAFLNADNDERMLVLLRAKLAEMIVRINPILYRQYVMYSKNGILYAICPFVKSIVWHAQSGIVVLQKATQ